MRERLEQSESQIQSLESQAEEVEQRMEEIEQAIESIESAIQNLESKGDSETAAALQKNLQQKQQEKQQEAQIANQVAQELEQVQSEINEVVSLDPSRPIKRLHLTDKTITARSIIIATGARPRQLGIPGEKRFFGKGVSTCATCDAPFFKDRVAVAVGGGDTAVQESLYLAKFARKVYLIHRRDRLRAAKILQERLFKTSNIEILWDSVPEEISGFFNVEAVAVRNVKTSRVRTLQTDGCFIWIGILPNSNFLNGSLQLDQNGFVVTDNNLETTVPGVFAAGDVRVTPLRQVATAVGDAAIAAVGAEHYIENCHPVDQTPREVDTPLQTTPGLTPDVPLCASHG